MGFQMTTILGVVLGLLLNAWTVYATGYEQLSLYRLDGNHVLADFHFHQEHIFKTDAGKLSIRFKYIPHDPCAYSFLPRIPKL